MHKNVIFREYDVRGVVDRDFDIHFTFELGQRFVQFLRRKKGVGPDAPITVNVGRDARLTGPGIQAELMRGMVLQGATVRDLGLVTSPLSYFSYFHWETDGSIMVTGSHNPPEYNGFKLSRGQSSMFGEEIQELAKLFSEPEPKPAPTTGSITQVDIITPYLKRYKEEFEGRFKKPLKVVLDCGNGAAGVVARKLFEQVGLNVTVLFEEPDGRFPNHHPDPTIEENLVELKRVVVESRADFGVGIDGDADRIVVVNEQGKTMLGDELMIFISRHILKERPGQKIIGDVKCSDRLYREIEQAGGIPIMWKTGHSLIKNKIKEEKAPFGGELSGHIFFADRNYGYDDAIYAALRVAEYLSQSDKTLSENLADLPPSCNTPELRIDTTEEIKHLVVQKLLEHFQNTDNKLNVIDGVRVSYPHGGWALARASNTQPVLVLRFEASSEEELQAMRSEFDKIVNAFLT
jgi:phosphomannomutase/phosphoglucomutase